MGDLSVEEAAINNAEDSESVATLADSAHVTETQNKEVSIGNGALKSADIVSNGSNSKDASVAFKDSNGMADINVPDDGKIENERDIFREFLEKKLPLDLETFIKYNEFSSMRVRADKLVGDATKKALDRCSGKEKSL